METKFPSLNPRDSLLMVGEELTRETAFTNYPVVEEDRLIGYLSLLELNELKPEIWERPRSGRSQTGLGRAFDRSPG
jgi:hypothetical protein